MDIEIGKYILEPSEGATGRFDIKEPYVRITGKGNKIAAEKILAYGLPLESALVYIINNELESKKNLVTLKEYLEAYIIEKNEILNIVKAILQIKSLKNEKS